MYSHWRRFGESKILEIQEKLEELEMEDFFNSVCEKSSELYQKWESTKSDLATHERELDKFRIFGDWTLGKVQRDEIDRDEYLKLQQSIDKKEWIWKIINQNQEKFMLKQHFPAQKTS